MKITFLASGNVRSNFSYRIVALASSLKKMGHDVSIIAPSADKYNNFIPEYITSLNGVKIIQPFQFKTKRIEINLFPYLFGAIQALFKEKPEVVYIYKPTPISVVGLIARFFRSTIITDFDDLGSEVMRIEGHPVYQRKLVEWSEKLSAHFAHKIVVASSYLFNFYKKQYREKPILIIPNGVDSEWFKEDIIEEETKRVVFMGSLNRKNILEPLFTILPLITKKYPELAVRIIGDGKYLSYFKEKAKELNLEKNITFTGWLHIHDARNELHFGDIGYNYMPDEITVQAASNMKVPQYMSRGVVPLVSDISDLRKTVENGKAGYVSSQNTEESLAETLLYALGDEKRKEKAREAIHIASSKLHWDTLAQHFEHFLFPPRDSHKKIYIVSTNTPGNTGGGEIRNYNLIKQMTRHLDAHIHVFYISKKNTTQDSENFHKETGTTAHIVLPHSPSLLSSLKSLLLTHMPPSIENLKSSGLGDVFREYCESNLPDVVHVEQLHGYYVIRPHINWLKNKGVKIVFDCHNVEFQGFKESLDILAWDEKLLGLFLSFRMKRLEIEASKVSDLIISCSEVDAEFFRKYNNNVKIVPNGVNVSDFATTLQHENNTLLFMGSSSYPPNADAIRYYLTEIHPIIKKTNKNIKLWAIGTKNEWLKQIHLDDSTVEGLGFVPDVKDYLGRATIGICPLRYGSGTRIKIMTYMAAGLPVVSTQKGAEGVEYTHEKNILLADTPEEFAKSVLKMLNDSSLRENIATAGNDFIRTRYDWDVIGGKLGKIYLSYGRN